MAAPVLADRVGEKITTTGTGTLDVDQGAVSDQFFTFVDSGIATGSQVGYLLKDNDSSDVEVGYGTWTDAAPDTFSRDTVTASRIAGVAGTSKISLSGNAELYITILAVNVVPYDDGNIFLQSAKKIDFNAGAATISQVGAGQLLFSGSAFTHVEVHGNLQMGDEATGVFKGNIFYSDSDQFPSFLVRAGGTNKAIWLSDVNTGNMFFDSLGDIKFRDNVAGGNEIFVARNSGAVQFQDGAEATPSIAFLNFTTTGWWVEAGPLLHASMGGTKKFTIDNVGNVVIDGELNINKASGSTRVVVQGVTNSQLILQRYADNTESPFFTAEKYRGTIASPTTAAVNDRCFSFFARAYNGTQIENAAAIFSRIEDMDIAGDASNHPAANWEFHTRDAADTTQFDDGTLRMTLTQEGVLEQEVAIKIRERAAAVADTAAYGQYWVLNTAPNLPYFTDDAGNDFEIATWPNLHRKDQNLIVNSHFMISQENGDTAGTATAYYPADEWQFQFSSVNSATFTVGRDAKPFSSNPEIEYGLKVDCTLGAVQSAGDIAHLEARIEGKRVAGKLNWNNTGTNYDLNIGFLVRADYTGSAAIAIQNSARNRSYVEDFSFVADTDTWINITVPADTLGSWLETTGVGLRFLITLGAGSSSQGTDKTWEATNDKNTSASSDIMDTTGQTFWLGPVILHPEPIPVPKSADLLHLTRKYEYDDMFECRRYFHQMELGNGVFAVLMAARSTAVLSGQIIHSPQMRAAPALATSGTAGVLGVGGESLSSFSFQAGRELSSITWNDAGTPFVALSTYGLTGVGASFFLQMSSRL